MHTDRNIMTRQTFFRTIRDAAFSNERPLGVQSPTGDLAPWRPSADNPWDESAVLHFYGRLGFMPTRAEVESALTRSPDDMLREAMDDNWCTTWLPAPRDEWKDWLYGQPYDGTGNDHKRWQDQEALYQGGKWQVSMQWIEMLGAPASYLRERLTLFWHNHFVVSVPKLYYPKHYYDYIRMLRTHAWGNFKDFAKQMTILPAMLIYLDGIYSTKDSINENYAREMMELFLVGRIDKDGKATYTQEDVRNIAYAVSGWNYWIQSPAPDIIRHFFAEYYFDFETKRTPLGMPPGIYGISEAKQFGLYTYLDDQIQGDIIDIIFEKRAQEISWHIAQKLYAEFVCNDTTSDSARAVIDQLAKIFRESKWDMKPMLETLFLSAHFFDPTFRGCQIKSPMSYLVGTLRHLDIGVTIETAPSTVAKALSMNQTVGAPPNVKGWPGYRAWLDSATISTRNGEFASVIASGGTITNDPGSITWGDDAALAWAKQFANFEMSLKDFTQELLAKLIVFRFAERDVDALLARVDANAINAWPLMNDQQKVSIARSVLLQILLLPHYQMC